MSSHWPHASIAKCSAYQIDARNPFVCVLNSKAFWQFSTLPSLQADFELAPQILLNSYITLRSLPCSLPQASYSPMCLRWRWEHSCPIIVSSSHCRSLREFIEGIWSNHDLIHSKTTARFRRSGIVMQLRAPLCDISNKSSHDCNHIAIATFWGMVLWHPCFSVS